MATPPSEEKRHYATILRHTLHAVRTRGHIVEFCRESVVCENKSVQKLVQEWSEGLPISAIVALDPEPVWWHLGDASDAGALRTDVEVRRFAGRLPHRLRAPLEVIGCKAADGTGVSSEGEERWLLGVAAGDALAAAAAEAIERGIVTASLGSATLGAVGAAATALRREGVGSVRVWAIGQNHSDVFTVGLHGIEGIIRCTLGFDAIFAAVQQVSGVKSTTEAARWFFSEKPPDSGAAERIVSALAPQLKTVLGAMPHAGSVRFACTGLTNNQAWFGSAMAKALGLSYWSPDPNGFFHDLQPNFSFQAEDRPSLSLLGTLHLAVSDTGGRTAWHPSWGLISRAPAAHGAVPEVVRSRNSSVAPTLPPEPRSVDLPAAATESAKVARAMALPARTSTGRLEANGESKLNLPTSARPTSLPTERKTAMPAQAPAVPAEVSAGAATGIESHGGPSSPSPAAAPLNRVPVKERTSPLVERGSLSSGATQPAASSVPAVTPSNSPAESEPTSPFPSSRGAAIPPREPTVVILRRRGYWPLVGIIFALVGAGLAGKFYVDAEAVKTAAAQQQRTAEQVMEKAEREVAVAVEQVRRAFEQAARSDVQARESATASAREKGRLRTEMEAARRDAVAQARREAEEETRKLLAPQLAVARAAASPGILKIASVPAGADVHVDGRLVARAPASIEGLSPGRHSIKLIMAGHVPQELTADIFGSKTTDLGALKLERATGAVAVASSPDQMEFSIRPSNTQAAAEPLRRGRTPAQFNDLPTGEYVVQFTRAGWPERTERVTIESGATARVATAFQSGAVRINSSPTGATVTQGGLLLGRTPLALVDVPPRDVAYELTLPGYEPLHVRGTVAGGRQLELNGTLLNLDRLASAAELRTPPRLYYSTPLNLGRVPRSTPPMITVSFVVPLNGSPQEIKVLDVVDKKVEKRSIEAIAKWKFFPGVSHAGNPVKVRMSMPVPIASRG